MILTQKKYTIQTLMQKYGVVKTLTVTAGTQKLAFIRELNCKYSKIASTP